MGNTPPSNILYCEPLNNIDKKPNETSIFRHPKSLRADLNRFSEKYPTIQSVYKNRLSETANDQCFGRREKLQNNELSKTITWYSKQYMKSTAEALGSGIINLGLIKEVNEWNNYNLKFVGIYSKNSLEYYLYDFACVMYGITQIPIYDTLGEEATEYAFK